jgi:phosphoadenosine phosphosulfate reductase
MIFLNKVAGEDRTDEIIAHGGVIGVLRFSIVSGDYSLDLRQAGAELFASYAKKNIVSFTGMSGHLKGKSIPGGTITEIIGEFCAGDPVLVRKGGKVGPGTSLGNSSSLKDMEKAVKIKDLMTPSDRPLSPVSDRNAFVKANEQHLKKIGSNAASDIRSFMKGNDRPLTVSFSGGKDSLAALGVTLNVFPDPTLIFVDTGIEFPETVEYVRKFAAKRRLDLRTADAGKAFWENVPIFGPPAKDFRWCCKVCKLGPLTDLISKDFKKGTVTVEGNRALESFARSDIGFVSKNPFVPNQTTLNPIRGWSAAEVWGYIWMTGLEYNRLYDRDFERIGCYLCASCLSSEWRQTETIHPDLYGRWESFLRGYAGSKGLPEEYAELGFWRWKVLPPKMVRLAEEQGLDLKVQGSSETGVKMLKGASPCAAGGYSMEAIVSVPRKRDFSAIEDPLRTAGKVRYSDDFEVALLRTEKGTAKLFGGGQVSITSKDAGSAEALFERSVKALLRAQMCTECGICVRTCPRNAVRMKDGFRADPDRCNSCGKCERSCVVAHYYDRLSF